MMANVEPKTAAEFAELFFSNHVIDDEGVGMIFITTPCPFCAAPGFLRYNLLEATSAMETGADCKVCERGAKFILQLEAEGDGPLYELVQTKGPDQPAWINPKCRRLS